MIINDQCGNLTSAWCKYEREPRRYQVVGYFYGKPMKVSDCATD